MDKNLRFRKAAAKLVKDLGGPRAAARALGVSQSTASGYFAMTHGMSAEAAVTAMEVTGVSAAKLNPDIARYERIRSK